MSKERVLLQVDKGCLRPYDKHASNVLRERNYGVGNVLSAELRKSRNPGFHRMAHVLGELVADNIEAFHGLKAHTVLKRLQIEGNIACDEIALNFPGLGPCTYRVPRSLSYESMDDGEFHETIWAMYRYVAKQYWPDLEPEQIQGMVDLMEAA